MIGLDDEMILGFTDRDLTGPNRVGGGHEQ
jgi:hypothetical protein